jgi:hypothetical protein
MDFVDQDPIPEKERLIYWSLVFPSGYFWCLHCERAFHLVQHRENRRKAKAARNQCWCGSYLALDGWDWGELRRLNPELPEVPVIGERYAQFADSL